MNLALLPAILIGIAVLLGGWRTLRVPAPHRVARIALQLVAAALIYLTLFPPRVDERFAAGTLVVLTPGATEQQVAALGSGVATVALPGAPAPRDVTRVPDLGTALRKYPDSARLRLIGGGLPPRDLDAARALPVEFEATAPPNGIVEVVAPATVRAGGTFAISGHVRGDPGGRIELHDPSGAVVTHATLADDGAFTLKAQAKSAGHFLFALRTLDATGATKEEIAQPVIVSDGAALDVLVLAGAPDPELKYLRRWAEDAGVALSSRMVLSDGIAMNDGAAALTADALAKTDVVIVDERTWKGLDANARKLLTDATRDGLGLFLRVTGTLPDAVAADWRELGFRVRTADVPETISLEQSPDPAAVLSRRALLVEADDAAPLVRASDGTPVALWRGDGMGRVAIWWLADSYRLALGGDAAQFGTLWSRALETVARARGVAPPKVPTDARVDERSVICGLADGAFVEQPDGTHVALSLETKGDARCAAYWPRTQGWHTLVSADRRTAFHAAAADAAPALVASRNADATRILASVHADAASTTATRDTPAPRWPFFAAWLGVVAMLWWLERTRPNSDSV